MHQADLGVEGGAYFGNLVLPFRANSFCVRVFLFTVDPDDLQRKPRNLFFPSSRTSVIFFRAPGCYTGGFYIGPG